MDATSTYMVSFFMSGLLMMPLAALIHHHSNFWGCVLMCTAIALFVMGMAYGSYCSATIWKPGSAQYDYNRKVNEWCRIRQYSRMQVYKEAAELGHGTFEDGEFYWSEL